MKMRMSLVSNSSSSSFLIIKKDVSEEQLEAIRNYEQVSYNKLCHSWRILRA